MVVINAKSVGLAMERKWTPDSAFYSGGLGFEAWAGAVGV